MSVLRSVSKWLRGRGRPVRKPARLALEALEDRCVPSVTQFPIPTLNSQPEGITRGPDGNLWFAEIHAIGRVTPGGQVTEFTRGLSPGSEPNEITTGPDGNVWFTEGGTDRIGRITPAGVITEFSVPNTSGRQVFVFGITAGPDGNLWFTEQGGGIGRLTPTGIVAVFPTNVVGAPVTFTATVSGAVGAATPTGTITFFVGNFAVAKVKLNGNGQASLTGFFSLAGTYKLTAVYSGDGHFAPSSQILFEGVFA
jgi:streptogramin lyase